MDNFPDSGGSEAIEEFLLHAAIELDIENKVFSPIGDVSEYFPNPNAAIVPTIAPKILRATDTLFLLREHFAGQVLLESIMLNNKVMEEVEINSSGLELGLRMSASRKKPKAGTKVYGLTPV